MSLYRKCLTPVFATTCLLLVGSLHVSTAENWPRFRGENGTGLSAQKGIPTMWGPGDYAWNIPIPGVGHSATIIWEDSLFVTSAMDEGALRFLFCLDAVTGQQKWFRQIGMNRSHKHLKNSWASSTPATDGLRIYATFADKENYLVDAYDFDGHLEWRRNLGTFESQHGLGVSPLIFEDLLIVPNDQDGPSSLVALDRRTGQTRWSVLRESRRVSYASPMITQRADGTPQLICVSGATGISGYDPFTGALLWTSDAFPLRTVASPMCGGGVAIASCGQGGRYGVLQMAVDLNRVEKAGSETPLRWTRTRIIPYVPTPIIYENRLYEWSDEGIVACVDLNSGRDIWAHRIGGNYSSSPVCIDGKLYGVSEDGNVVVLAASPEFKLFGKTALEGPSHSTPSVANGRLYLRTFHRLFCLEAHPE